MQPTPGSAVVWTLFSYFVAFLCISKKEQDEIQTYPQRSEQWLKVRSRRLGGSSFGQACGHLPTYYRNATPKQLVETIVWGSTFKGNPATEYGTRNEPVALVRYVEIVQAEFRAKALELGKPYPVFAVEEGGFFVNLDEPYMGCSPDGIVRKIEGLDESWGELYERYGKGDILIEIKCPFKQEFYPQIPWQYYDQITGNMALRTLRGADFITWTPESTKIEYFSFDSTYWNDFLRPALQNFWFCDVMPALLDKANGITKPKQTIVIRTAPPSWVVAERKKNAKIRIRWNGDSDTESESESESSSEEEEVPLNKKPRFTPSISLESDED